MLLLSFTPKEGRKIPAMKTARFLIFVLIVISLLFISNVVGADSRQVNVSAVVDEHLSYERQGNLLEISTNYPAGLTLISHDIFFQTSKPSVENINCPGSFSIFPNF